MSGRFKPSHFACLLAICLISVDLPAADGDLIKMDAPAFAAAYLLQDTESERIQVRLFVQSGEAGNPYPQGLAHYLEHLVWLGLSEDRSAETGVHSNAWTTHRLTHYMLSAAAGDLEDVLGRIAGVFNPPGPALPEAMLLKERDIIRREYDLRFAQRRDYPVLEQHRRLLYEGSGLARSVIGAPGAIAVFSPADARALHRQTHVPANAVLLVTGDITAVALQDALDRLEPAMGSDSSHAPAALEFAPGRYVENVTVPGLAQPRLIYSKLVRLPERFAGLSYLDLYSLAGFTELLLSSSLSGGLLGPLTYDDFIARDLRIDLEVMEHRLLALSIEALPDTGVSLPRLLTELEEALQAGSDGGWQAQSFDRIKARYRGRLENARNRSEPVLAFTASAIALRQPPAGYPALLDAAGRLDREIAAAFVSVLGRQGRVVSHLIAK